MIAYLKGKLAHKDRAHVIIDVNGVGYEVKISLQTYAALADGEESCKLYTHLQVKEDSHTLVGFHSMDEKLLFSGFDFCFGYWVKYGFGDVIVILFQ